MVFFICLKRLDHAQVFLGWLFLKNLCIYVALKLIDVEVRAIDEDFVLNIYFFRNYNKCSIREIDFDFCMFVDSLKI